MLRFTNTFNLYRAQLQDSDYWINLDIVSGITVPDQTFVAGGGRNVPIALTKEIVGSDFFYGLSSDGYGEIEKITFSEATVAKVYKDSNLMEIKLLLVLLLQTLNLAKLYKQQEMLLTQVQSMHCGQMKTSATWM